MPLDATLFRNLLREFDFRSIFIEELGWDNCNNAYDVLIDNHSFTLNAVAEKRGMVSFICNPLSNGNIPDYSIRRKIEGQISKSVHEHIIIYTDKGKTTQIWQWVKREAGKPTACREHTYHINQPGHSLIQKLGLIAFSMEEEESLTLFHVTGRTRDAFDVERITKRFYDRFKTEHDAFYKFILGIPDDELHRWYASVMLNRLMFIYFIQKKGFLDKDDNYLGNKLSQSREQGKDLFYKTILCPLFFEGFAKKESERSAQINKLLGEIPYLNGGLFLKHQIEDLHEKTIQIADTAFEKLFDFFDQYLWHLDERPLKKDNEINPDVLGYIFEKYINQKQMGAYYTKEDITEYISKNTVIPFLFDTAKQKCKIAFEGEQSIWRLSQTDPDRYFYSAVKKGVELPLPKGIAIGIKDVSRRNEWNKPASPEYALPTEIWREVVARRQRYDEVRAKIINGEVRSINDFITYNLDIRQFAQDVIYNSEGPELLRAFYHAIENVTVLDPTCGSGAFLFAALNILEPLYEACLERMQVFIDELDRSKEKHRSDKFSDFRRILKRVSDHPNLKYFIFKSIIVNNLYGVDIMEEAVEICKLRLFLKLVAQVESAEHIEPLPDIDFNIRAGNTLIGFATYEEVKRVVTSKLDFENTMERIEEQAQDVERLFKLFHQQQTELGGEITPGDKQELLSRLKALEDQLNQYIAGEYGINSTKRAAYAKWLKSHQPFHWFIEFYGILKSGGFDVIIGNPPYVEYKNIRDIYTITHFETEACGDLYAYIMERSIWLLSKSGRLGMIVPISIVSTDGFASLRNLLVNSDRQSWVLNFAERPSKLFVGVEKRLTVWLMQQGASPSINLSNYRRWFAEERDALFSQMSFVGNGDGCTLVSSAIPKIKSITEMGILRHLHSDKQLRTYFIPKSKEIAFYTRKLRYFVQFFDFVPQIKDSKGKRMEPSELKTIYFSTHVYRDVAISVLNSNLFFWFFNVFSDVRNVNRREIETFRCSIDNMSENVTQELQGLSQRLMGDFQTKAKFITADYGTHGVLTIQSFQPRLSKPIIDEIDRVLAKHYGFTDEELDFIINYDIKYRMGRESGDE